MTRPIYHPQLHARWRPESGQFSPIRGYIRNRWIAVPILICGLVWAGGKLVLDFIFGRFE